MTRIDELIERLRQARAGLDSVDHPGDFAVVDERDGLALFEQRFRALGPEGETFFELVDDEAVLLSALRRRYPSPKREEWVVGRARVAPMFYPFGLEFADHLVARSGTVVLDLAATQESLSSLVVEEQVVVASAATLVNTLDQLPALTAPMRTRILISGPSRTADIEKTLVIPAHGPCRTALFVSRSGIDAATLSARFFEAQPVI